MAKINQHLVADFMIPSPIFFLLPIALFHIYKMSAPLSAEKGRQATTVSALLLFSAEMRAIMASVQDINR